MDNAQKAIMIGVGLFITIIIISVVLLITNLGTGMVDEASGNVGNMSQSLQDQIKRLYDKKQLRGSDVKNLYNQYKDSDEVFLIIQYRYSKNGPTAGSNESTRNCGVNVNKDEIKEVYYNPNNCTYAAVDEALGKQLKDLNKPGRKLTSKNMSEISPTAKYESVLIYNSSEVIGILCRMI